MEIDNNYMMMLMHEERLFAKIQYPLVTKNKQPNTEQNICNVLNPRFQN